MNPRRIAVTLLFLLGAVVMASLGSEPRATAELRASGGASQAFCDAEVNFSGSWSLLNLDFPGQPFFSDGNNDGIADQLQVGRAGLPLIATELGRLAGTAPSDLQGRLLTLASDLRQVAVESTPGTAAQSHRETASIESVAASLQPDIRGKNCFDMVGREQDATAGGQSSSDSSGLNRQAIALGATAFVLLLNLPLMITIWRHRRRPTLKADGSRFRGNLRRWKVYTVSGQVLHVQREIVTTTTRGSVMPGGWISASSSTTTKDTIRLVSRDGIQTVVSLVNFGTAPSPGDSVTICTARRRSRTVPFALLNHTTGRDTSQSQGIVSLREGGTMRQMVFLMGLVFSAIISMVVAVFGGAGWLVAVWFALLVMWIVTVRRSSVVDLQPLKRRATAELERV